MGTSFVTLRNGQILRPTADALWTGPLSGFLDGARQRFYGAVVKALGVKKWDTEGRDDGYPKRFYTFFLERVLFYTRQRGHGGTILVLPSAFRKRTLASLTASISNTRVITIVLGSF